MCILRRGFVGFFSALTVALFVLIFPVSAETHINQTQSEFQQHRERLPFDDYLQSHIERQDKWFNQFFPDRFFKLSRDVFDGSGRVRDDRSSLFGKFPSSDSEYLPERVSSDF